LWSLKTFWMKKGYALYQGSIMSLGTSHTPSS
jgi:hypothetical protein